jgi:hypothetical protein
MVVAGLFVVVFFSHYLPFCIIIIATSFVKANVLVFSFVVSLKIEKKHSSAFTYLGLSFGAPVYSIP